MNKLHLPRPSPDHGPEVCRFVEPGEVASLVCWLLSTAGRAVTGQAFNVCGGEFFA